MEPIIGGIIRPFSSPAAILIIGLIVAFTAFACIFISVSNKKDKQQIEEVKKVYRNGTGKLALLCLAGGLAFGVIMGSVFSYGFQISIISGILFGTLFALFMSIFLGNIEQKFEPIRDEISKERKIICEGPANHKKAANAIGGWLFLIEDAIEFHPHQMNIDGQSISIFIDDISTVETRLNQIRIRTKTDETFAFVVNKAKLWKKSITEILETSKSSKKAIHPIETKNKL